jgi:hypothetical protein
LTTLRITMQCTRTSHRKDVLLFKADFIAAMVRGSKTQTF